jgi:hypothetical protein
MYRVEKAFNKLPKDKEVKVTIVLGDKSGRAPRYNN